MSWASQLTRYQQEKAQIRFEDWQEVQEHLAEQAAEQGEEALREIRSQHASRTTIPPTASRCSTCGGDGRYYGAGHVENGVFVGFIGKCFRCAGKGYQTRADELRNERYDSEHRSIVP